MVSNELKEVLKSGTVFAPDVVVFISDKEGQVLEFTDEDLLSSVKINKDAITSAGSPIGALNIGEMIVELQSYNEFINTKLDNKKEYTMHASFKFGEETYITETMLVDSIETDEEHKKLTIKGYDQVKLLDVEYEEVLDKYPAKASAWLEAFSKKYNISILGDYPFKDEMINQPNIDNMSARQVLSKFLEWNVSAGYYHESAIRIFPIALSEPVDVVDRNSANNFKVKSSLLGKYGVNTVTLALDDDIEGESHTENISEMVSKEGKAIEIRLSSNPFFSTPEERKKYAKPILELLKGFNYTPYEMTSRLFYIQPLQTFTQSQLDGFVEGDYNVPVYSYSMSYDGAFVASHSAPVMENAETQYKWNQLSPRKRTEILVNKLEGVIDLTTEELEIVEGLVKENSANIELTKEQIKQEVKDRETSISNIAIGGTNLVLDSNVVIDSESYLVAAYDLSEDWIKGQEYTISLKGDITEGQKFGIWANGPSVHVTTLNHIKDGIYGRTFTLNKDVTETVQPTLRVYDTPSDNAEGKNAHIDWIKLEKGNKRTDWSPAPEDLDERTRELESNTERLTESVTQHSTLINQTAQGLETEISERIEADEQLLTETTQLIEASADALEISFAETYGEEIKALDGDLTDLRTYYRLSKDGAIIGKDNSPLQISISNEQIDFIDNGEATAYINGQKMYITSLEVLNDIILGDHQWSTYSGARGGSIITRSGK